MFIALVNYVYSAMNIFFVSLIINSAILSQQKSGDVVLVLPRFLAKGNLDYFSFLTKFIVMLIFYLHL